MICREEADDSSSSSSSEKSSKQLDRGKIKDDLKEFADMVNKIPGLQKRLEKLIKDLGEFDFKDIMQQIEHLKANKLDKDALDDLLNRISELERVIQEKLN